MIGVYSIGSAAIASLPGGAVAGAILPPGDVLGTGGSTKGKKPRIGGKGAKWSMGGPDGLSTGFQGDQSTGPIEIPVRTAFVVVRTYAATIAISEAIVLKVSTSKINARGPKAYRIRIPENPTEKELLAVIQRLLG